MFVSEQLSLMSFYEKNVEEYASNNKLLSSRIVA